MLIIQPGNTTAKITSQHGLFYDYLINTFSIDFAKGYLDANQEAIDNIKNIINEEKINCDFEVQDNFVYTDLEEEVPKIQKEVLSVNSLGFDAQFVQNVSAPIKILAGIKFPNQAQFNPIKYVYGLCNSITNNNGEIYEYSKVYDVKKEDDMYITSVKNLHDTSSFSTDNYYLVKSKYLVLASHYPIINVPGFYFLKMYQEASYLIGVETNSPLFDGMYINTKSPITSLRTALYNDKKILLIGGSEHKVGIDADLSNCYTNLENIAKSIYKDAKVLFKWQTRRLHFSR